MFCSIIIPTIGREVIAKAVLSVLHQSFSAEAVEVIVVNDSGRPLPDAAWQDRENVQIITTQRRERCFARNTGAAVAQGRYLIFLDDDDWLLPEALSHFWELAHQQPEAVWLYGVFQVVDEQGVCLAEVNSGLNGNCFAQIVGGAWAPIKASMILTQAFFAVGGYDPAIIGTEDLDLCRRLALQGEFANTDAPVACLFRGETWDTSTNYLRAPEDTLRSRDIVLNDPHAFRRLIQSADSSYWHGRILRVYLSLVRFHVRNRQFFKGASRAWFGFLGMLFARFHLFAPAYWQGVKADHPPQTLHFIMRDLEQQSKK
jgi:glycosyltransferase involved in cell wall biosynthesis